MSHIDKKELELKRKYFSAQKELQTFLCNKYWKYLHKPVVIKSKVLRYHKGSRIGWYLGHMKPTFINDARIHRVSFDKKEYCLCEDEFDICKKKVKNEQGQIIHFVDVKCPKCSHITIVDMQYLVWKYNCQKCKGTITINDRVKKSKINHSDYR